MAISYSTAIRNAMLDAITSNVGTTAKLRIYSGTRPANVAAAITGTLLAELTCNATFAPAASGGVLTLNAITQDSSADNTGTATHFRLWNSGASVAMLDGDVGTSGSDLNLTTTSITSGQPVSVTSFVITEGNA
jgi:hypothetical protein